MTPRDQIADVFLSLTAKEREELDNGIDDSEKIFRQYGHEFAGLRKLYKRIDQANISSQQISSCKKGCAFCCHIRVAITELEARFIIHYCKTMGIEIDTAKLEDLRHLDEVEYMLHPNRKCTFLAENNTCKIYEARPASCRNYYVTSDPSLCDTNGPSKYVETFINWESVMPSVALLKVGGKTGSLPDLILNELK